MSASLHCCTTQEGEVQILEIWGRAETKEQSCGVMVVETVNHHWLHPTSILDVDEVF
jgi:hypothetical protein